MRVYKLSYIRKNLGFAFIWTLFLVAFVGVGLTAAIEISTTAAQRDKEKELISIGRQFRSALRSYYESATTEKKEYPNTLNDLLLDSRTPGIKRHLRQVFVDPMTGKPNWGLVIVAGKVVGIYSISKKKPIKQDLFEPSEASFRFKDQYREWVFTYPENLILSGEVQLNEK